MLAELLVESGIALTFNMLEVGALPIEGETEPSHALLEAFPGSKLALIEIDPDLCEKLNRSAPPGMRYYPCALGRTEELRTLYLTRGPACTSLYEPDERYADLFNLLDAMRVREISDVDTISLDTMQRRHALGALDFLKIDVQGAELDIFQGGTAALSHVLMILCEVEFVPLYKNQPLFCDIDVFLRERGFMFHKFLGMAGRVMKPMAVHGTGMFPVNMMWSDAVYTRDVFDAGRLAPEKLLKLAVLFDIYESKDFALHLVKHYDAVNGTRLAATYTQRITASGEWLEKKVFSK